jgi:hypothetical protein
MKKTFLTFLILMISKSKAQESKIDSTKYERYKFETGILIPLGNLKDKFEISQQFGFWYRTRIEHNDMMDFGLSFYIPSNPSQFTFKGNDSIFSVKPKGLHGMIGFRVNKLYNFKVLNQKITLEWSSSIGYSFFIFDDLENRLYDKNNPPTEAEIQKKNEEDRKNHVIRFHNTYSKALSTLHLGQGITLNYNHFGLQCHYNFTPYNWFSKRIDADFGNSSLSLGGFYKF